MMSRRRAARLSALVSLIGVLGCGSSERTNGSRRDGTGGGDRGGSSGSSGAGGTRGGSGGNAGKGEGGEAGDPGATGGAAPDGSSVSLDGSPIYTRVQRLTVSQWEHAVTDILRFEAPQNLSARFRVPARGDADFTNNEKLLNVDAQAALDFESGSEAAAALATGTPEALTRLDAGTTTAAFVTALGRRAFRRPLTDDELSKYEAVFALGERLYGPGFANGAALVVRAMLQSPQFLYRSELGPAKEPLNGYEAASKLSFWLLDTTPSDALLDSAAAGDLDTADGLERAAREMLGQRASAAVMRDFHDQAYRFDRYRELDKPDLVGFDDEARAELVEASNRFFDAIFEGGTGLREILTSNRVFMGPHLAPLYGMVPPSAMEERVLPDSRAGYFLQVPFLLLYSDNDIPGTLGRGIVLNTDVLCNALPPPPADSVYVEPLGFAFAAFDGFGREVQNGSAVDTSGSYPFADGTRSFDGAKELVEIMADTAQAHTCYAKKLTGYALQRDMVENDRPLLEALSDVSRDESLKEMVISLVRNPAFRLRSEGVP